MSLQKSKREKTLLETSLLLSVSSIQPDLLGTCIASVFFLSPSVPHPRHSTELGCDAAYRPEALLLAFLRPAGASDSTSDRNKFSAPGFYFQFCCSLGYSPPSRNLVNKRRSPSSITTFDASNHQPTVANDGRALPAQPSHLSTETFLRKKHGG